MLTETDAPLAFSHSLCLPLFSCLPMSLRCLRADGAPTLVAHTHLARMCASALDALFVLIARLGASATTSIHHVSGECLLLVGVPPPLPVLMPYVGRAGPTEAQLQSESSSFVALPLGTSNKAIQHQHQKQHRTDIAGSSARLRCSIPPSKRPRQLQCVPCTLAARGKMQRGRAATAGLFAGAHRAELPPRRARSRNPA